MAAFWKPQLNCWTHIAIQPCVCSNTGAYVFLLDNVSTGSFKTKKFCKMWAFPQIFHPWNFASFVNAKFSVSIILYPWNYLLYASVFVAWALCKLASNTCEFFMKLCDCGLCTVIYICKKQSENPTTAIATVPIVSTNPCFGFSTLNGWCVLNSMTLIDAFWRHF